MDSYTDSGKYGKNLLAYNSGDTIQIKSGRYSLRAIPSESESVKVIIHFFDGDNSYGTGWVINSIGSGWDAEWINKAASTIGFYDNQQKTDLDCVIDLVNSWLATISIYEYDFETPARIINIKW